ncbi:MAG: hypothetical protein IPH16_19630 [Haliscomenobacter sp.]|nr:hypothetical protein [Haliscomenobacter sp.]
MDIRISRRGSLRKSSMESRIGRFLRRYLPGRIPSSWRMRAATLHIATGLGASQPPRSVSIRERNGRIGALRQGYAQPGGRNFPGAVMQIPAASDRTKTGRCSRTARSRALI